MKHISSPLHTIMARLILLGNCPDDVLIGTPYAILIALREFPEKSQREIASQVGCDPGYVNRIKNDVLTSQHLSPSSITDRVTGKDGKSYPARRQPAGPERTSTPREDNRSTSNIPPTRTDSLGRTRPTSYAKPQATERAMQNMNSLYRLCEYKECK